jgi:hypothetical protein
VADLSSLPPDEQCDVAEAMRTAVTLGRALREDSAGAEDLILRMGRTELQYVAIALGSLLGDAVTMAGLSWDAVARTVESRLSR